MTTYRTGSHGDGVRLLQQMLTSRGFSVYADAQFGPKTEAAVRTFQQSCRLTADGIAGSKTLTALADKLLPVSKGYIYTHITRQTGRPVKYIAIHYTAGSCSSAGAALAVRKVFISRMASADFVVDDADVIQINPDVENYYCWSVGDKLNAYSGGGRLFGKATNRNTVSIEICSVLKPGTTAAVPNHAGWSFTDKAVERARLLVHRLMLLYDVPKSNVVRHYDISGKMCPGIPGWNDAPLYTTDGQPQTATRNNSNAWNSFLSYI